MASAASVAVLSSETVVVSLTGTVQAPATTLNFSSPGAVVPTDRYHVCGLTRLDDHTPPLPGCSCTGVCGASL